MKSLPSHLPAASTCSKFSCATDIYPAKISVARSLCVGLGVLLVAWEFRCGGWGRVLRKSHFCS